jgi:hypothetical protein
MTGYKTGGRQKGTPNKTTADIRNVIHDLLSHELEYMISNLDKLPDDKRFEIILKLMPYVVPKLQPQLYHDEANTPKRLVIEIVKPDQDIEFG